MMMKKSVVAFAVVSAVLAGPPTVPVLAADMRHELFYDCVIATLVIDGESRGEDVQRDKLMADCSGKREFR